MRAVLIDFILICVSLSVVSPNTEVVFSMNEDNTNTCREKNKKQLKEVEDAQLAAHRCMIRDVAVKVPEPEDFITDAIFPSHIVVPRCSGVCVNSAGLTCHPKKKPKIIAHEVVLYNSNGTQVCRHVELEHHKGPCKCSCQLSNADCSPRQVFSESQCSCHCDKASNADKYSCALDLKKYWDDRQCACLCKTKCPIGLELDFDLCICKDMMSSCSISPLHFEGAHPAKIATYVGISAIGIVAVTILVSMYFMVSRKRPYSDLRTDSSSSSVAVVPQAAYSITINQSQQSPCVGDEPTTPLSFDDKTRL